MRLEYTHVKEHIPVSVGEQVHVNHDSCPAGTDTKKRLYIRRTNEAILAYCHNCGGHLVKRGRHKVRSIEEIQQSLVAKLDKVTGEVLLPDDCLLSPANWPTQAASWLYKYELDRDDITKYSITYSPSLHRVILPVYQEDKLVYWQGRRVDDDQEPKYLNITGVEKPLFFASCGLPKHGVCIVEDIVSAIKVAKAGKADAIALLGTNVPDDLAACVAGYQSKWAWFDPDDAGKRARQAVKQRIELLTGHCAYAVADDHPSPKDTPLAEMRGWHWHRT